jgi:hypothetical protein
MLDLPCVDHSITVPIERAEKRRQRAPLSTNARSPTGTAGTFTFPHAGLVP